MTVSMFAPSSEIGYFFSQWWKDVKSCVGGVGLPAIANALNPFSLGVGTAADVASQMSQSATLAAGAYSVERGLIQPLSSSAVRSAFTGPKLLGGSLAGAETLGKVSGVLTMGSVVAALGAGVVAEWNRCL
jgi:hypothetical protein